MKRIFTAIGHPIINDFLRKNCPDLIVERDDIESQEELFKILHETVPDVLILREDLSGKDNRKALIEKIRKTNNFLKVIIIVSEIEDSFRDFLYSKGIHDILINHQTGMAELIDAIDSQTKLIVKTQKVIPKEMGQEIQTLKKLLNEKPKVIEKHIYIENPTRTQKQEIIAFSGTSGSGKSSLLVQLATLLSQKAEANIICLDLNTEFPALDQFFGVPRQPETVTHFIGKDKNSSLNYMIDSIDKGTFDNMIFEELSLTPKKLENVKVVTGNYSLYDCQHTLNTEYYSKILDKAKELFDFMFVDTSSNLFVDSTRFVLKNATTIMFTTEATYLGLRKTRTMLDLFVASWDVSPSKIKIVINRIDENSLDNEAIKEILKEFEVVGFINYNTKHQLCLNKNTPMVLHASKREKNQYLRLLEGINFVEKRSLSEKLFGVKEKKVGQKIIEHNSIERGLETYAD